MKYIWFLLPGFFFLSCAGSGNKIFSDADSLVIQFSAETAAGKTVATGEKDALKKVKNLIKGSEMKTYNCRHDGTIYFFKDNVRIAEVSFNYSDEGCKHFLWAKEGRLTATQMNNEGADFLQSLAEGRSWY